MEAVTPIRETPGQVDLEKKAGLSDDSTEFRIPSRCNSAEKQQIVDAVWGVQEAGSPE